MKKSTRRYGSFRYTPLQRLNKFQHVSALHGLAFSKLRVLRAYKMRPRVRPRGSLQLLHSQDCKSGAGLGKSTLCQNTSRHLRGREQRHFQLPWLQQKPKVAERVPESQEPSPPKHSLERSLASISSEAAQQPANSVHVHVEQLAFSSC